MLFLLVPAFCAHAHDVHRSRAEAEYNASTQRLEVSLTVFVSDLELALTRQAERRMSLTSTPATEVDAQLQRYLKMNFIVTDGSGKVERIEPLYVRAERVTLTRSASGKAIMPLCVVSR